MNLWLPQERFRGLADRKEERRKVALSGAQRVPSTAEMLHYISTEECQDKALRREKTAGRRNEYHFISLKKLSVIIKEFVELGR